MPTSNPVPEPSKALIGHLSWPDIIAGLSLAGLLLPEAAVSRRMSVHPEGGVMVSLAFPMKAMWATSTSPEAVPAGFDSVTLFPPVAELVPRRVIVEYVSVY